MLFLERFQFQFTVEALHVDLADTFRAAHHVGRVHCFVGRDHHKLLGTELHAHVGDDLGAIDVVHDCLARVVFHHGHVFVCGGMEHIVRAEGSEHALHACTAADAGHHHFTGNVREFVGHHQADVVLRCLGLVDEHHLGWVEGSHLSDDLGADGAG